MTVADALRSASISRVLLVDDDLSTTITLADLDAHGGDIQISAVLADGDHEITHALDQDLRRLGRPHANAAERAGALADPGVRASADPRLRNAYEAASNQRADFRAPLEKIKLWVREGGQISIEEWDSAKDLAGADRYDLLIVDYYLVNNNPEHTLSLIKRFKDAHLQQQQPLLVILTSSNISVIERDFESIRNECQMSASRFRILAKPVTTNSDPVPVVKEKWVRALRQLANERALVTPIEQFVKAWEKSLNAATLQMIQKLYDLDASALAILAATAKRDAMTIEEYTADVLSRRISAESEEMSFPFDEITALETALSGAQGIIGPTIDQGVEVRHAQRAIRSLMSDVVWHRPPWWVPRAASPALVKAGRKSPAGDSDREPVGDDVKEEQVTNSLAQLAEAVTETALGALQTPAEVASTLGAGAAASAQSGTSVSSLEDDELCRIEPDTQNEARLSWMKRYIRFGTVVRRRISGEIYVNLTQACDVQSERLCDLADVHYLFIQGAKFPIDRVATGEKVFDSPYFCSDPDSDEFFVLQWRLRRMFTPSMARVFRTLEQFEIIGQLRSDSAYAVLARYTSQASRVAQIRMPKVYRYAVNVYHKMPGAIWEKQELGTAIEASAWQKDDKDWRIQFSVTAARALVPYMKGVSDPKKVEVCTGLTGGLKVEGKTNALLQARAIKSDVAVILMRLDGKASYDGESLLAQIGAHELCKTASEGATLIFVQALS